MADISEVQDTQGNVYDIDAKTVNGKTVGVNVPSTAVFTDTKVTQTATSSSDNNTYRVLLSKSANNTTETDTVQKASNISYSPKSANLSISQTSGNSSSIDAITHVTSGTGVAAIRAIDSTGVYGSSSYAQRITQLSSSNTSKGIIVQDVTGATPTTVTKDLITVDNDNQLKSNCIVKEQLETKSISLTQSEYDALVSAGTVDPNVTYYISDMGKIIKNGVEYSPLPNAAGVPYDNTNSGLSATNVQGAIDELCCYSTRERIIGSWTDGKPLYESIVSYSQTNISSTKNISISSLGANFAFIAQGIIKDSSGNVLSFPYFISSDDSANYAAYINSSCTTLTVQAGSYWSSHASSGQFIIHYTKS